MDAAVMFRLVFDRRQSASFSGEPGRQMLLMQPHINDVNRRIAENDRRLQELAEGTSANGAGPGGGTVVSALEFRLRRENTALRQQIHQLEHRCDMQDRSFKSPFV